MLMKKEAKSLAGFISSALGGGILAMVTWALFAKPEEIGSTGLTLDRLAGMSFSQWFSGFTVACAVAGGVIGLLIGDS